MSLIQSAKLNGHDPQDYLKGIFTRLPTHLNSRIHKLLPHDWKAKVTEAAEPAGGQESHQLAEPDHTS